MNQPPRLGILACAVLEPELQQYGRDLEHVEVVEVLEQGLHNDPDELRTTLQAAIDRVENIDAVEAVVLLYGLCSRGVEGLTTRRCRLVIPRAHDCITLLLGSKERYAEYAAAHPGTYWYSPGWIATDTQPGKKRYETAYAEYLEKYGEDNADYLMEVEQNWIREYDRATYVDLGVGDIDNDIRFTRECADYLGWRFDRQHGDPGLLIDLLRGQWDEERFLVLEPGQTAKMTADERVLDVRRGDTPPTKE